MKIHILLGVIIHISLLYQRHWRSSVNDHNKEKVNHTDIKVQKGDILPVAILAVVVSKIRKNIINKHSIFTPK